MYIIPWQSVDSVGKIITSWGKSRSQHSQKVHQHVMAQGNHMQSLDNRDSQSEQQIFHWGLKILKSSQGQLKTPTKSNGMRGVKPTRFGQVYHKRWEISKLNVLAGPNYAISWFPLLLSLQRLKRWWSCRNMHVSCLFLICLRSLIWMEAAKDPKLLNPLSGQAAKGLPCDPARKTTASPLAVALSTFGKKPFTRCATSLTEHSDSLWKIQNESIINNHLVKRVIFSVEQSKLKPL